MFELCIAMAHPTKKNMEFVLYIHTHVGTVVMNVRSKHSLGATLQAHMKHVLS